MSALFLPFTPKGKSAELLAIQVKKHLSLEPTSLVDPMSVLERVPARLVDQRELWGRDPQTARALLVDCRAHWSGIGFGISPDDGAWLILLNPSHALTRRRATLMEEIVHIVLDHPMTRIILNHAIGVSKRTHDSRLEDEAFNVGAACLLPFPELFHALHDAHETAVSIAERNGLSVQYVEYRINRSGLYAMYRKRVDPGGWRRRTVKEHR